MLRYLNNVSLKRSMLVSVLLVVAGWLNAPNVTFIPDNVKLISGPASYNFLLYEKLGFIYPIIATIILLVVTYYIERPLEKLNMSTNEVIKKYEDFGRDAKQLYVIGKDLDFLQKSEIQKDSMKKLEEKCKVLCSSSESKDILDMYKELYENKVDIRKYGNSNTVSQIHKLRGQLKETSSGVWEGFFVQKSSTGLGYEEIKIDNQFILESLKNEFKDVHSKGVNPIIKCIALDLGGVYFDGDYNKDFVYKLNHSMNLTVSPNSNDTLVLDDELNLGDIDIVEFWERKAKKQFTKEEKNKIKDTWEKIWKPNEDIKKIMIKLAKNGYNIVPFSNLDRENGEMYLIRGDFNKFKSNHYFSYKYKLLKPNEKFFVKLMKNEGCKPYEILLIDDKLENINMAKKLNWHTIHFSINDGYDTLINLLREKSLDIDEVLENSVESLA